MHFNLIEISENDYLRLSKLLTQRYGLKLPLEKRIMFQARLQTRLRELSFNSFSRYCQYILEPENTQRELEEMIDYISTNKTDFFRENEHFLILQSEILPSIFKAQEIENPFLNCWSAGCSKGQEAYSLAMLLDDFRVTKVPGLDFHILGTDVSRNVLKTAQQAIYPFSETEQIPHWYRKRYLLKSKDKTDPKIRIGKSIRAHVDFCYSNLMDEKYNFDCQFQIIFLRNTLIYFEQPIQTDILRKVLRHLQPGGYLFIGHSESLINRELPIEMIAPSVYQKTTV